MKVLHVGAHDKLIFNYFVHLQADKVRFDYVLRSGGVDFHYKNDVRFNGKLFYITPLQHSVRKWIFELRDIARKGEYDIIHLHIGWASIFGLVACYGIKSKLIIHNHNFHRSSSSLGSLIRRFIKFIYNQVEIGRMSCSESSGKQMFDKEYFILKNAVNYEDHMFSSIKRIDQRHALGITDQFVLVNIGNLHFQKNQIFLLHLTNYLVESGMKDIVLLIVGADYGERQVLSNYVTDHSLQEYIKLCGSSDDVQAYLSAADVFLFPSLSEGFGMALLEAQICGLRCLASKDLPRDAEITNNVKWLGIKDSDVKQWADAIIEMRKNGDYLFRRNVDFSKNYNISEVSFELMNYYNQIIRN